MSYLAIFLGGGLGSLARYGLARWAINTGKELLWGTLAANVLACLILGYLAYGASQESYSPTTRLLLATGFCGGFSTFSTFSLEAFSLLQSGRTGLAVLYVGLSIFLGLGAFAVFALK
ncbi:MAG: fluoride efflux transporter CrcB [Saprospiraceae bacterium]